MSNPRHLRSVEREPQEDKETVPLTDYYAELVRLEDAKREIANDISDLMRAAKQDGHDAATLKEVAKIARLAPDERDLKFQRLLTYAQTAAGIHIDLGFHGK